MKIFPEERQNLIADFINGKGKATIHQLSRQFGVSIPTVRRDLSELETKNIIHRSHGGAVAKQRVLDEISFEKRMKRYYHEKLRIAKYAVSMIKEGDVVILDTGTTNYWIASLLKTKKNITVITNSLKAAVELASNKDIKHILVGGSVHPDTFAMYGSLAIEDLRKFNADKVFIGAAGLHWQKGLTEAYEEESSVKKVFIEVSRKKIVVADHSKLGAVLFSFTAPLSKIDMVISDSGADLQLKRKFDKIETKFTYV
jgi:DeoR family fructose operon transcriptional repressor